MHLTAMRLALITLTTLCFLPGQGLHAADDEALGDPWRGLVGRKVVAEGIAWGALEKGLGQRLVLDDHRVYVENLDFRKLDLNGKLVRITGTLRLRRAEAAPPGAQGYSRAFNYYAIEVDNWQPIERVNEPVLLLLRQPGGKVPAKGK